MKKTFKFDFNLSVWMRDIEIEAETGEEARDKLWEAIRDYLDDTDELDTGYADDFDITDLDIELVEACYKVKLQGIDWVVEEEDVAESVLRDHPDVEEDSDEYYDLVDQYINDTKSKLPADYEVLVYNTTDDEVEEDAVIDTTDEVGWLINTVDNIIVEML